MNVLIVRPLLFQARALMTQGVGVCGACIWDENQDPSITPALIENNQDITWLSWYPKSSSLLSLLNKAVFFRKAFNRHHIDIVQINGLRDLGAAYLGRLFAKTRPSLVVTSHNPGIWKNSRQTKSSIWFLKLFADGIITLSMLNYDLLITHGIRKEKVRFIPNAFLGKSADYSGFKRKTGETMLFCPATVVPRKNQLALLKAVNELKNRLKISLYLAGDLDADPQYVGILKNYCRENKLEEQVHFLGRIPHAEVLHYFEECTAMVFPTKAEMMPRAIIEAMWLGKPVIASGVDGIVDLIRDHQTGILVNVDDVQGLVNAVLELVEDPKKADQYAREGQKFVRDFCSLENVGQSMLDFYRSVADLEQ